MGSISVFHKNIPSLFIIIIQSSWLEINPRTSRQLVFNSCRSNHSTVATSYLYVYNRLPWFHWRHQEQLLSVIHPSSLQNVLPHLITNQTTSHLNKILDGAQRALFWVHQTLVAAERVGITD